MVGRAGQDVAAFRRMSLDGLTCGSDRDRPRTVRVGPYTPLVIDMHADQYRANEAHRTFTVETPFQELGPDAIKCADEVAARSRQQQHLMV